MSDLIEQLKVIRADIQSGTVQGCIPWLGQVCADNIDTIIAALEATDLCQDEGCPHHGTEHVCR